MNGTSAEAPAAAGAGLALRDAIARARAWVGQETFWLQLLVAWVLLLALRLPQLVGIDTWLALAAGRELERDGLPRVETMTLWARGEEWIDQQWLGHLVIYGVTTAGGLRLALLLNVAVLAATLLLVLLLARRLGASARSTAVGGALCILAAATSTSIRTETLTYVLFAALLWLVLLDRESSSWRLLLALPLLVLWANVHGSVVVAAGIVTLFGLVRTASALRRRERPPVAAVLPALLAPLTVLASPYGTSLVGYYGRTVGNDFFPTLLAEWSPPTLAKDWRVFVLIGISGWLVARHGHRLSWSARLTYGVLLVGALLATRNAVWFALFAAAVVPLLLDEAWPPGSYAPPRRAQAAAWAVLVLAVVLFVPTSFARPAAEYESSYPPAAAESVAAALRADPSLRVLAGERFADWLLWKLPEARGRVAFDARFELLPQERLDDVTDFLWALDGWPRLLEEHRLVVLERARHAANEETLRRIGGRVLYRDELLSVFLAPSARGR